MTPEMKEMAAHLLQALAPAMGEIVKAEVAKHLPAAAPIVNALEAAAEVAFGKNEPGVGGPAPEVPEDADLDSRMTALEHKVDALVQATGHGNSVAMGAHL